MLVLLTPGGHKNSHSDCSIIVKHVSEPRINTAAVEECIVTELITQRTYIIAAGIARCTNILTENKK